MPTIHTHYDNLKVSRNAPQEVIRAAYRTLAQKFHPDLNRDNREAARIMSIINSSYEVISDPRKREEYDSELKAQELARAAHEKLIDKPQIRPEPLHPTASKPSKVKQALVHVWAYWSLYFLAGGGLWFWYEVENPRPPPQGPKPYNATHQPSEAPKSTYYKPVLAPNGQAWPAASNYVAGYKRLHTDGLSNVTVDNKQNDSDVFVKLVSIDGVNAYPIRQFFIPARSSFTVRNIRAGLYDMRHRDLNSGQLSRSEAFELVQTETQDGTQFSNMTMTLFKVQNGNMQSFGLSEGEF